MFRSGATEDLHQIIKFCTFRVKLEDKVSESFAVINLVSKWFKLKSESDFYEISKAFKL